MMGIWQHAVLWSKAWGSIVIMTKSQVEDG